jgi:uncharacterized protein YuzE
MEKFDFNYDEENDDLFVYSKEKRSNGAVELGNFILDFDTSGNLVAMEITEASKVISKIVSKMIELNKIKEMRVEIVNFRNMDAIKFEIFTDSQNIKSSILIPNIREKSPVLRF